MIKKQVFLTIPVLLLAFGIFTGCDERIVNLSGTTWVYQVTKAEFAALMVEEGEMTLEQANAAIALMELMGMKFPLVLLEISFTASNWTVYQINPKDGERETMLQGTYTQSGNVVELTAMGEIVPGTISGNRLTITLDGENITFTQK